MKIFKYILTLTILGALAIGYSGCSKDDSSPSNTDLLSKGWKIQTVTINGTVDNTTDYSGYSYTFTKDGAYTLVTSADTKTGTWAFNSNETAIIRDAGTADELTISLVELLSSSLTIEFTADGNFKTADELNLWVLVPA